MRKILAGLFVVAAAYACSVQQGHSATLSVRLANRQASPAGPLSYLRKDATTALLKQLHVTVSTVSLDTCAISLRDSVRPRTWLASWPDLLMPSAHAHSPTAAGKLGVPHVIAFVGSNDSTALGTVTPEGYSCRVTVLFGPADSDAVGMPADQRMLAHTARADFAVAGTTSEQKTDFSLTRSYPLTEGASGPDVQIELVVDVAKVLAAGLEGDASSLPPARWVTAVADATTATRIR